MIHVIRSKNSMTTKLIYDLIIDGAKLSDIDFKVSESYSQILSKSKNDIFIVGDVMQAFRLLLKRKKVIMWFQGVLPEERYMIRKSLIRKFTLNLIEKFVFKKTFYRFLVSKALYNHFKEKYNSNIDYEYLLLPCFSEKNIIINNFTHSSKYKNQNFVYAGSLHKWQYFEYTLELYKEVEVRSGYKTKLFILTPELDNAKLLVENAKIVNYEIKYVKPEHLNSELANIKYGFIVRDDSIVNHVSTPTKLSAYISNGIIPIFTDSILDFSEVSSFTNYRICLDTIDLLNNTEKILDHFILDIENKAILEDFSKIYENYYNYDKYKNEIAMLLKTILVSK